MGFARGWCGWTPGCGTVIYIISSCPHNRKHARTLTQTPASTPHRSRTLHGPLFPVEAALRLILRPVVACQCWEGREEDRRQAWGGLAGPSAAREAPSPTPFPSLIPGTPNKRAAPAKLGFNQYRKPGPRPEARAPGERIRAGNRQTEGQAQRQTQRKGGWKNQKKNKKCVSGAQRENGDKA